MNQSTLHILSHRLTHLVMGSLIVLFAILYVYFANAAVRTVAELEGFRDNLQIVRMRVSELESQRFAYEHTLSKDAAYDRGFVEVNNPLFIVKSDTGSTLSMVSN